MTYRAGGGRRNSSGRRGQSASRAAARRLWRRRDRRAGETDGAARSSDRRRSPGRPRGARKRHARLPVARLGGSATVEGEAHSTGDIRAVAPLVVRRRRRPPALGGHGRLIRRVNRAPPGEFRNLGCKPLIFLVSEKEMQGNANVFSLFRPPKPRPSRSLRGPDNYDPQAASFRRRPRLGSYALRSIAQPGRLPRARFSRHGRACPGYGGVLPQITLNVWRRG
jgi:hypothetical protein